MSVDIIAVAALAVITCLICVAVRQYRPEFAVCIGVSYGVICLIYLLNRFSGIMTFLDRLAAAGGLQSAGYTQLLKGLGISIVTAFAADICVDAGQNSLASKVEFAGRIALIYLCIPLMSTLIEAIEGLLS